MAIFGIKGIIDANIKTYFKALSKGLSEDDALKWVLQSRYAISERKRQEVEQEFKSELEYEKKPADQFLPKEENIKKLVRIIIFYESPRLADKYSFSEPSSSFIFNPKPTFAEKLDNQINEIYESLLAKQI